MLVLPDMLSFFQRKILNLSFRYKELLFQSCLLTNLNFLCDTVHPKCPLAFSNDVLSWPFFSGGKVWWWTVTGTYNLLHFACLHTASYDAGAHQASLAVSQYLGLSRRGPGLVSWAETSYRDTALLKWLLSVDPRTGISWIQIPSVSPGLQSAKWCFLLSASSR